jgi:hypothetical protein
MTVKNLQLQTQQASAVQLGNGGIHIGMKYSVWCEANQYE